MTTLCTPLALLLVAGAPPPAGPVALSQGEAVHRALERSPALAASRLGVQAAEIRVDEARTAWIPRVTLEGSYRYSGPVPTLSIDTGITPPGASAPIAITREIGTAHSAAATLRAAWRAYDFGVRSARIEAAEAAARAARADGPEREAELAYAVRAAYLGALFSQEAAAVTRSALKVARSDLEDERLRKKAGVGNELDIASANQRVAELEARLVDIRRGLDQALTGLRVLLGLPEGAEVRLTDSLSDLAGRAVAEAHSEEHPIHVRLRALRAATELQMRALSRGFWPTIDVFAQVAYQYPRTFVETDQAGFTWAAGVMLTWELLDGDLKRRQRKELAAEWSRLEALDQAAAEDIRRQVTDAATRLAAAGRAAKAAERAVGAADVYARAARVAVKAGTGTTVEVRKAQQAVDQARLAQVRSRLEAALALADRMRALGIAERRRSNEEGKR